MKQRILVVDDNADAAELMAALLENYGMEVHAVHSGAEALRCAPAFRPHIALLDIGMPGMDGFETARRMRGLGGCETTRIIALTAWSDDHTRRMIIQAGFERHLVKPAPIDTIVAAISDTPSAPVAI